MSTKKTLKITTNLMTRKVSETAGLYFMVKVDPNSAVSFALIFNL